MNKKESKIEEIQQKNAELKNEMERTQNDCDERVILLQEDNEATRLRLRELQQQRDDVMSTTEIDGRNSKLEALSRDYEVLQSDLLQSNEECNKLRTAQTKAIHEWNNEKNERLKLEKDLLERNLELKNTQNEIARLVGMEERLNQMFEEKNKEVLEMKTRLERRSNMDETILNSIEKMKRGIDECVPHDVIMCDTQDSSGEQSESSDGDLCNAFENLARTIEMWNNFLVEERRKREDEFSESQNLQTQNSVTKQCRVCERRQSGDETMEDIKTKHLKELETLQSSIDKERQTMKSQTEELKLKLTSKVILLQSDIREQNATHEREIIRITEIHQEEVDPHTTIHLLLLGC